VPLLPLILLPLRLFVASKLLLFIAPIGDEIAALFTLRLFVAGAYSTLLFVWLLSWLPMPFDEGGDDDAVLMKLLLFLLLSLRLKLAIFLTMSFKNKFQKKFN